MNARSLDTSSGFSYDRVRKTLQHVASIPPLLTPAWSTTLPPTPAPLRQNTLRQLSQVSLPTWWSAPNDQTTGSVPPVRTTPEAGLQIHSEAGSPGPPAPHDEVDQRSITTETPDPTVPTVPSVPGTPPSPASEHDLANGSPKPPVTNLEVDSCSITTEPLVPTAPTVPTGTPTVASAHPTASAPVAPTSSSSPAATPSPRPAGKQPARLGPVPQDCLMHSSSSTKCLVMIGCQVSLAHPSGQASEAMPRLVGADLSRQGVGGNLV